MSEGAGSFRIYLIEPDIEYRLKMFAALLLAASMDRATVNGGERKRDGGVAGRLVSIDWMDGGG